MLLSSVFYIIFYLHCGAAVTKLQVVESRTLHVAFTSCFFVKCCKDSTNRRKLLQEFQRELAGWKVIVSGFTGSSC